jgi:hypothetical protein
MVLVLFWFLRLERGAPKWLIATMLVTWLLAYFLVHWLLNIKPWDRYLLPTLPVFAVLVGLAVGDLGKRYLHRSIRITLVLLLILLMLPSALRSGDGVYPIGGDHGNYDGIEEVAQFFERAPYGTVLYDHWLSWELRYYLFDSRVYVSWFPHEAALVRDLGAFGTDPARYLIAPTWEDAESIIRAVEGANYVVDPVFHAPTEDSTSTFIVYTISQ